ncbi:MAG: DNA gyrase subunit A [Candidatus Coatesbacteria bacterium]
MGRLSRRKHKPAAGPAARAGKKAGSAQLELPVVPGGKLALTVENVDIEDEMKSSYIDYAMSVIIGRALPDIRDGLKPVQRRILYQMHDMGATHEKPFKKSALIVGDVMGKLHPHGSDPIYESQVRMAQDFWTRYPLVQGQGNYGSMDGDPPAAMRYTECRLASIATLVLADIGEETVDFIPSYDNSRTEPVVLPTQVPLLLANGTSGIAVGMATNIPPHNLSELSDALILLLESKDATLPELMKVLPGPDFPGGGLILGREGIKDAYATGRGSIQMQARVGIEEMKGDRQRIVVTELPYQVNKAQLITHIAELAKAKTIEGISDLRDESDRDGVRIVIEVGRGEMPQVILNRLYKHTELRTSFGVIMLAISHGQPRIQGLKGILEEFIAHRKDVVVRRTRFQLARAEARAHILEGLKKAVSALERVIKLIRNSKGPDDARVGLMKLLRIDALQAQAILDLRLAQLSQLERLKLDEEYRETLKTIARLKGILDSERRVREVIKDELEELKKRFGDPRRTEITGAAPEEMKMEDLVPKEEVVISVSHAGYVKRQPLEQYRSQKRGGKGVTGAETKEEDWLEELFIADTHADLLFFTNLGRVFWLKAYQVPEAGRYARGKALVNLLKFQEAERVCASIAVSKFRDNDWLTMATRMGNVKRIALTEFQSAQSRGVKAISIRKGDELIGVGQSGGTHEVVFATAHGKAIRFKEKQVRAMGRSAGGVRGISLAKGDRVVGMALTDGKGALLTVAEHGFGKRTPMTQYRVTGRGGKGIANLKVTDKTGPVVAVLRVDDEDEVMLTTAKGIFLRSKVGDVRVIGRNAQGVHLIRLEPGDKLVAAARLAREDA